MPKTGSDLEFLSVDDCIDVRNVPPEFVAILKEVVELHARKCADYGSEEDPYANVSDSAHWGVDPWVGAAIRMSDKERRLKQYATTGTLSNEGVRDSLIDNCVYPIIRTLLYDRQRRQIEELFEEQPQREFGGGIELST